MLVDPCTRMEYAKWREGLSFSIELDPEMGRHGFYLTCDTQAQIPLTFRCRG
jgi:hypothetical protein